MAKTFECSKCGADISDTFEAYDPSVGIMSGGWYCETCDISYMDEDDDEPEDYR